MKDDFVTIKAKPTGENTLIRLVQPPNQRTKNEPLAISKIIEMYLEDCQRDNQRIRTIKQKETVLGIRPGVFKRLGYRYFKNNHNLVLPDNIQRNPNSFLGFLELHDYGDMQVHDITPDIIKQYINFIMNAGLSSRSVNGRIEQLRTLFNWSMGDNAPIHSTLVSAVSYISTSPLRRIRNIKDEGPSYLSGKTATKQEFELLLLHCKYPQTLRNLRNTALLWTLLVTGARINEIAQLRIDDLDLYDRATIDKLPYRYINIRPITSKTRQPRRVPYPDELRLPMERYLAFRAKHWQHMDDNPNLWVRTSNPKKPPITMSHHTIRNIVPTLTRQAGINFQMPNHIFRITAAVRALQIGMPQLQIRSMMGWSNTSKMLDHYTRIVASNASAILYANQYNALDALDIASEFNESYDHFERDQIELELLKELSNDN